MFVLGAIRATWKERKRDNKTILTGEGDTQRKTNKESSAVIYHTTQTGYTGYWVSH